MSNWRQQSPSSSDEKKQPEEHQTPTFNSPILPNVQMTKSLIEKEPVYRYETIPEEDHEDQVNISFQDQMQIQNQQKSYYQEDVYNSGGEVDLMKSVDEDLRHSAQIQEERIKKREEQLKYQPLPRKYRRIPDVEVQPETKQQEEEIRRSAQIKEYQERKRIQRIKEYQVPKKERKIPIIDISAEIQEQQEEIRRSAEKRKEKIQKYPVEKKERKIHFVDISSEILEQQEEIKRIISSVEKKKQKMTEKSSQPRKLRKIPNASIKSEKQEREERSRLSAQMQQQNLKDLAYRRQQMSPKKYKQIPGFDIEIQRKEDIKQDDRYSVSNGYSVLSKSEKSIKNKSLPKKYRIPHGELQAHIREIQLLQRTVNEIQTKKKQDPFSHNQSENQNQLSESARKQFMNSPQCRESGYAVSPERMSPQSDSSCQRQREELERNGRRYANIASGLPSSYQSTPQREQKTHYLTYSLNKQLGRRFVESIQKEPYNNDDQISQNTQNGRNKQNQRITEWTHINTDQNNRPQNVYSNMMKKQQKKQWEQQRPLNEENNDLRQIDTTHIHQQQNQSVFFKKQKQIKKNTVQKEVNTTESWNKSEYLKSLEKIVYQDPSVTKRKPLQRKSYRKNMSVQQSLQKFRKQKQQQELSKASKATKKTMTYSVRSTHMNPYRMQTSYQKRQQCKKIHKQQRLQKKQKNQQQILQKISPFLRRQYMGNAMKYKDNLVQNLNDLQYKIISLNNLIAEDRLEHVKQYMHYKANQLVQECNMIKFEFKCMFKELTKQKRICDLMANTLMQATQRMDTLNKQIKIAQADCQFIQSQEITRFHDMSLRKKKGPKIIHNHLYQKYPEQQKDINKIVKDEEEKLNNSTFNYWIELIYQWKQRIIANQTKRDVEPTLDEQFLKSLSVGQQLKEWIKIIDKKIAKPTNLNTLKSDSESSAKFQNYLPSFTASQQSNREIDQMLQNYLSDQQFYSIIQNSPRSKQQKQESIRSYLLVNFLMIINDIKHKAIQKKISPECKERYFIQIGNKVDSTLRYFNERNYNLNCNELRDIFAIIRSDDSQDQSMQQGSRKAANQYEHDMHQYRSYQQDAYEQDLYSRMAQMSKG